jgi:hypothetical protein
MAGALSTVAGLSIPPAAANPAFSQKNPPPLCSAPHTAACIDQPRYYSAGVTATPILVDKPTLETVIGNNPGDVTERVTFAITHFATAKTGYSMRPPSWANPMELLPIDGYSDPTAAYVVMAPEGNCTGHLACSYVTTTYGIKGGWYYAGHNGLDLVSQDMCPTGETGSYGCGATVSQSAVYVPSASDLLPPRVKSAANGKGLTSKAVAAAKDPYGKAMTLTWDFGDGAKAPGSFGTVVTHTYATFGDYSITARVRTSDGRSAASSTDAGILPPKPILQAVARNGTGTTGVAAGLVQAWPDGASGIVRYWNTGCPADPDAALNSATSFSDQAPIQPDGTISVPFSYLDPDANAFVLFVQGYLDNNGHAVSVHRVSNCVTSIGSTFATSADMSAGATEVPVDSASVAIGDVAVIDAGTGSAEQRLITGHGSIKFDDGLTSAHSSGALVIDAGAPVPPYVAPGPPANPTTPTVSTGGFPKKPGKPTVTNSKPTKPRSVVVSFKVPANGGSTITSYLVKCTSSNRGVTRTASAKKGPIKVTKLTTGKHYTCRARATNAVGAGLFSAAGNRFTAPGN